MTAPLRPFIHPRDELLRTMERIYRHRMTTTSGGNLSIRDTNGDVWITPGRVDKGNLKREDMVCVRADGRIDGPHKPSSEYPFHKAIYDARPDLKAIVHAHPVALVAFSVCRQVPDTRLFHQAWRVCGAGGFAPYALPGSAALGKNIAVAFRQGHDCVVLENHGVVVGGDDLTHAFARFETFEFTARTIIEAQALGDVRYLSDAQVQQPRLLTDPLPEFTPEGANELERELRKQLVDFIHRGYRQRLLISTEGSFSARLGEDTFLITPSQIDRSQIDLGDLVVIRRGARESGRKPSRATRLHRAIYQRHPQINAIVNAYPVHATAFSVTNAALDSRTIPESYLFLRDVSRIPYGTQFRSPDEIAEAITPERPAALLENDGALVAGSSVLDAFDRLEVLETTAEAILRSRPLGPVSPMSTQVIDELCAAFGVKR